MYFFPSIALSLSSQTFSEIPLQREMAISTNELFQDNAGSDSDANSADDASDCYQPISAADDEDENSDQESSIEDNGDHFGSFPSENPNFHQLSNGYVDRAQNGIAALHLNGDEHGTEEEGEEAEAEERMREASELQIARAFREDESRRNAPITPDNAIRIMDAMRGISFGGLMPDWADQVPEDRWVDQLRRLRQPPPGA